MVTLLMNTCVVLIRQEIPQVQRVVNPKTVTKIALFGANGHRVKAVGRADFVNASVISTITQSMAITRRETQATHAFT